MADYISRETAIAFAEHAYNEWNLAMGAADGQRQINRCFKMQELCKAVASVFADSPAADVQPVVRCRDCKWYEKRMPYERCFRSYGMQDPDEDDFCSFGERRKTDGQE